MLGAKLGITSKQYNIVTDRLIMHYEPSFNKSWPGGSSLYNLASGSLTPTGSIVTDATMVGPSGSNGGYMYFDGSDGYINIPETPFTSLSNCSVVYWAKVFSNAGSYRCFISGRSGATTNDFETGINVDMMSAFTSAFDRLNIEGIGRIGFQVDDMTSSQPFDTWVHVGVTVNNTLISVYINNVPEGTRARSDSAMNLSYIQLGARNYSSTVSGELNANVGQYLIYDRVLSADEISQNYNATKDRYTN